VQPTLPITDDQGRPVAHGCGRPASRRPGNPRSLARDGQVREQPTGPTGLVGLVRYIPAGDQGPPGGLGTVRLDPAVFTGDDEPGEGGGTELVFTLETLAGPCDHRHQAKGHDPGRMLRHLTGILNAHCTLPPCRRPERTCDYEHSKPFDQGGKTCLCDAGPVCRHDHRAKQSPGWHLEQAGARGWFRWTMPSGRSYLNGPTRYPD
jgi:hypothetical protein